MGPDLALKKLIEGNNRSVKSLSEDVELICKVGPIHVEQ